MRNERGITLIALVVTIVVLLILAGVTITYALGNGGLFTSAQKAELNTELGNLRDYASLTKMDILTKYYENKNAFDSDGSLLSAVKANFPGYASSAITEVSGSELTATSGALAGKIEVTLNTTDNPDGHTKATIDFSDIANIDLD